MSTDHAGDIHITRATTRIEPPTSSLDRPLLPHHPDGYASKSQESLDHHWYQNSHHGEDAVETSIQKRRLPSPEAAARQTALPQTGKERWGEGEGEEEEEERAEQHQWSAGGGEEGALQSSESHKFNDRPEQRWFLSEEGHHQSDGYKSRGISGGKNLDLLLHLWFSAAPLVLTCSNYQTANFYVLILTGS